MSAGSCRSRKAGPGTWISGRPSRRSRSGRSSLALNRWGRVGPARRGRAGGEEETDLRGLGALRRLSAIHARAESDVGTVRGSMPRPGKRPSMRAPKLGSSRCIALPCMDLTHGTLAAWSTQGDRGLLGLACRSQQPEIGCRPVPAIQMDGDKGNATVQEMHRLGQFPPFGAAQIPPIRWDAFDRHLPARCVPPTNVFQETSIGTIIMPEFWLGENCPARGNAGGSLHVI